jgi:trigger factor
MDCRIRFLPVLRQLGREVRIKGFRPGKVPARVIEQRFGSQVRSEALGEVIRSALNSALMQENLRPARAPAVEATKVDVDGEIAFTATFEVMPEVGTVDVSALKVIRPVAEVKDADIDHMIETLRLQRRSWNEVERAATVGDMVMFESSALTEEGRVPAEGVETFRYHYGLWSAFC